MGFAWLDRWNFKSFQLRSEAWFLNVQKQLEITQQRSKTTFVYWRE